MSTESKGIPKDLNIEKMNLEMTVMHNGSYSMNSNMSMKSKNTEEDSENVMEEIKSIASEDPVIKGNK